LDCRFVHERLTALMFDELPARELEIIQPHLASCRICIADQEAFTKTFATVQAAVRSGGWVPDQFAEKVTTKLAPRHGKRFRHDRGNMLLLKRVIGMAVAVLIGVTAFGLCVVFSDHMPHWLARHL
jgi:hypothetical protein